ncbi:unknown [Firmicutes bacterium CAG:882]|nr:unknown [Firmicutes bacterium CAG:882]
MNNRMFKLAFNTAWCDIKHCFTGYRIILMLVIAACAAVPPDNTTVLCFAWVIEMMVIKMMPCCGRMLFIMPTDVQERKRFMVYRQLIMEGIFAALIFLLGIMRYVIYGYKGAVQAYFINNLFVVALMLFEMGSAVYFCGWYKNVTMNEKGFGIFFSIMAWISFFTGISMSAYDAGSTFCKVATGLGIGGVIVQGLVKLYYMVRSEFDEYKYVNVGQGLYGGQRKKSNAADERF